MVGLHLNPKCLPQSGTNWEIGATGGHPFQNCAEDSVMTLKMGVYHKCQYVHYSGLLQLLMCCAIHNSMVGMYSRVNNHCPTEWF